MPLGPVLAAPYRPLFALAGVWAVVGVVLTAWPGVAGRWAPPPAGGVGWHGHEMLFGFAGAAFAGYVLTAMRSWAGPHGPARAGVAALVGLWMLGRLAAWGVLGVELRLVVPAGAAFMAAVTLHLGHAALRRRSVRGAGQALLSAVLTGIEITILSGLAAPGTGVLGFALLLSVVGGRMVMAFSWNRLDRTPAQARRFAWTRHLGRLSAAAIVLAVALDLAGGRAWTGSGVAAGVPLGLAALAEAARLALWQPCHPRATALLALLHLGYLWLPAGLALAALSRAGDIGLTPRDALHALAAGAVACSVYAVALRPLAWRGAALRAARLDVLGFALVWVAAALRVFGPEGTAAVPALWCAGWGLFLYRHIRALPRPLPRPVFSGPKG